MFCACHLQSFTSSGNNVELQCTHAHQCMRHVPTNKHTCFDADKPEPEEAKEETPKAAKLNCQHVEIRNTHRVIHTHTMT